MTGGGVGELPDAIKLEHPGDATTRKEFRVEQQNVIPRSIPSLACLDKCPGGTRGDGVCERSKRLLLPELVLSEPEPLDDRFQFKDLPPFGTCRVLGIGPVHGLLEQAEVR